MFKKWRRRRAVGKAKPGDGHPIKSYRWWQFLTRSLFYALLPDHEGRVSSYAVNIHYFSEEEKADLYREGVHHATSKLPAAFPVPGGVIEVATTMYGPKRMHFVTEDGQERQLYPEPSSLEGLRARFGARYPGVSSLLGWAAILILLVSLTVGVPQLAAAVSQLEFVAEHLGSFESPITLPDWANGTLGVLAVLASVERAVTLRNHWLIDLETGWFD